MVNVRLLTELVTTCRDLGGNIDVGLGGVACILPFGEESVIVEYDIAHNKLYIKKEKEDLYEADADNVRINKEKLLKLLGRKPEEKIELGGKYSAGKRFHGGAFVIEGELLNLIEGKRAHEVVIYRSATILER